ncbi:MAG TPA: hypothetical protein GXZ23_05865 [Clostridiales bacterium]|nr:hypothetical protein [Clostridiales bacterium]
MVYYFYVIIFLLPKLITAASLVYLIIGLIFCKEKKKVVRNVFIIMLIPIFITYGLYYAGDYSKWRLNRETKERLLTLSITDGKKQRIPIEDLDLEFDELYSGEILVGDVSVEVYENWEYPKPYLKLYETKLYDDDSFVFIRPSEGDKDIEQIPLISSYLNTVVVVTDNCSLKISFRARHKSSKELNAILDKLEEMKIIAFE